MTVATAAPLHTVIETPVGPVTIAAHHGAVTAVLFDAHRHPLADERIGVAGSDPVLAEARVQLEQYFAGERQFFDLPLSPQGTPFQQRVWALLRGIPYGTTRSYGSLALELGDIQLARAVGAANGRNPISIVVPCHRVIGANGKLVGFGGGIPRKQHLLAMEARVAGTPALF